MTKTILTWFSKMRNLLKWYCCILVSTRKNSTKWRTKIQLKLVQDLFILISHLFLWGIFLWAWKLYPSYQASFALYLWWRKTGMLQWLLHDHIQRVDRKVSSQRLLLWCFQCVNNPDKSNSQEEKRSLYLFLYKIFEFSRF